MRRFSPERPYDRLAPHMGGQGIGQARSDQDWKHMYRARIFVERNWRTATTRPVYFTGHTDSVYCVQFDEYVTLQYYKCQETKSFLGRKSSLALEIAQYEYGTSIATNVSGSSEDQQHVRERPPRKTVFLYILLMYLLRSLSTVHQREMPYITYHQTIIPRRYYASNLILRSWLQALQIATVLFGTLRLTNLDSV